MPARPELIGPTLSGSGMSSIEGPKILMLFETQDICDQVIRLGARKYEIGHIVVV
jgi:hypothetical protein